MPIDDRARVAQPIHDGRVVRRQPALENPRRARGRHAPRAQIVLERDRNAGQRPGIVAPRDQRVDLVGACPRVVGEHEVERVHVGLARVDPREVLLEHVTRAAASGANVGRDRDRRLGHRSRRLAEDAGHPEPAVFRFGRGGQHLVAVETRPGDVGAGTR